MWGWVHALIKGILDSFFQDRRLHQAGMKDQEAKDLDASLHKQQDVQDAVNRAPSIVVDDSWLRRKGRDGEAPDKPVKPKTGAH